MKNLIIPALLFGLVGCSQQNTETNGSSQLASIKINKIGANYDRVELQVKSTTGELELSFAGEEHVEASLQAGSYHLELDYFDADNELIYASSWCPNSLRPNSNVYSLIPGLNQHEINVCEEDGTHLADLEITPILHQNKDFLFSEKFDQGLGQFSSIILGDGQIGWRPNHYQGSHYAEVSGFKGGEVETWLVSDPIDLAEIEKTILQFSHILAYASYETLDENLALMISNDYSGDVNAASWTELPLTNSYPELGTDPYSEETLSEPFSLQAFNSQSFVIAFVYTSNESTATPRWQVTSVSISAK